jgi:hypothetical protein
MMKHLNRPVSRRMKVIVILTVALFGGGIYYWATHVTDNLAGRF